MTTNTQRPGPTSASPARMRALVDRIGAILTERADVGPTAPISLAVHDALARAGMAELLTPQQRQSEAPGPTSRVVHAEERFSVVALVIPPGGQTTIHDHLTWCVVGVLAGTEYETVYDRRGRRLVAIGESTNPTGSVAALTPPGDIHRVRNPGHVPAISLHVYGIDVRRYGSSVRRTYLSEELAA
jgi:3-mercaptopropionate dioxygenase